MGHASLASSPCVCCIVALSALLSLPCFLRACRRSAYQAAPNCGRICHACKTHPASKQEYAHMPALTSNTCQLIEGLVHAQELARRLPEPEERQSKSQEDLLHGVSA